MMSRERRDRLLEWARGLEIMLVVLIMGLTIYPSSRPNSLDDSYYYLDDNYHYLLGYGLLALTAAVMYLVDYYKHPANWQDKSAGPEPARLRSLRGQWLGIVYIHALMLALFLLVMLLHGRVNGVFFFLPFVLAIVRTDRYGEALGVRFVDLDFRLKRKPRGTPHAT